MIELEDKIARVIIGIDRGPATITWLVGAQLNPKALSGLGSKIRSPSEWGAKDRRLKACRMMETAVRCRYGGRRQPGSHLRTRCQGCRAKLARSSRAIDALLGLARTIGVGQLFGRGPDTRKPRGGGVGGLKAALSARSQLALGVRLETRRPSGSHAPFPYVKRCRPTRSTGVQQPFGRGFEKQARA